MPGCGRTRQPLHRRRMEMVGALGDDERSCRATSCSRPEYTSCLWKRTLEVAVLKRRTPAGKKSSKTSHVQREPVARASVKLVAAAAIVRRARTSSHAVAAGASLDAPAALARRHVPSCSSGVAVASSRTCASAAGHRTTSPQSSSTSWRPMPPSCVVLMSCSHLASGHLDGASLACRACATRRPKEAAHVTRRSRGDAQGRSPRLRDRVNNGRRSFWIGFNTSRPPDHGHMYAGYRSLTQRPGRHRVSRIEQM